MQAIINQEQRSCLCGVFNMCTPKCRFFPENCKKILDKKVVDGVVYRQVVRLCGYTGERIKNWDECFRPQGPLW